MIEVWSYTNEDVYAVVNGMPSSAALVGLRLAERLVGDAVAPAMYESIPQCLSRHGVKVSAVQRALDALEADGRVVKVRGVRKGMGYITDEVHAERERAEADRRAEATVAVIRREAERIVLERHAAEVRQIERELIMQRA